MIIDITQGIFPIDNCDLPYGIMKDDSNDILSYFHHYHFLDSEDNKKKFAISSRAGSIFSKREKWNLFINKN